MFSQALVFLAAGLFGTIASATPTQPEVATRTVEARQVISNGPIPDGQGWAFYLYERGDCQEANYVTGYVSNMTTPTCVNFSPYEDIAWDTVQVFKGSLYNINLFSEPDCPYGDLNNPIQYDCSTNACVAVGTHGVKSYLVYERVTETCSCCASQG